MSIIQFSAMPTPTYDDFESVTVSANQRQGDCRGSVTLYRDMPVEEAEKLAADIIAACKIVRAERD